MNLYKEYSGIQEDVTWSDINYTPFANRAFIHKLGKALSGNSDFILEGCAFSKIAGTSASVTAGYVFDETSGEVVQVDAQTVAETLGTNNWTLVKTTTYDPAGNNTYRTGGPNDNYQQERMVLTNVVSVGSGFDVENIDAGSRTIARKYLEIGAWDMDADASIDVSNTITGVTAATIRNLAVIINDDGGLAGIPLASGLGTSGNLQGGVYYTNSMSGNKFVLSRTASGDFDSTSYDDTSINRGFIVIDYEV